MIDCSANWYRGVQVVVGVVWLIFAIIDWTRAFNIATVFFAAVTVFKMDNVLSAVAKQALDVAKVPTISRIERAEEREMEMIPEGDRRQAALAEAREAGLGPGGLAVSVLVVTALVGSLMVVQGAPARVLHNFELLKHLDLSSNSSGALSDPQFMNLTEPKEIRLSNNQIGNISSRSFVNVTVLFHLYLRNNQRAVIYPSFLQNFEQLEQLPPFPENPRVRSLEIASYGLKFINESIFDSLGNDLVELRLISNSLTAAPFLGKLKNPQVLNVTRNELETVGEKSFDEQTPGNEFRSLICVCDMVALHLVAELKCSETRSSLLFQSTAVCKKLENYSAILRFFALSFQQIVLLTETLDENSLFPSLDCEYSLYRGILKGIESSDASCFYGRTYVFQFAPNVTSTFNVIGINSATYSLSWESETAAFSSLLNFVRYFLNPEEGARRIMKVTREADLEFCRDFWNLSEIPPPKLFCPTMEINKIVLIPMNGPIRLDGKDGRSIEIFEPSAHGPSAPIQMRILSATNREGLSSKKSTKPLSFDLLLHCDGGGYVARSSKSHETYLRLWAKYLDCSIVSVDYSLAPKFPFPRPIEEVLYAYAWIVKNPEKFGWDGKKLLRVGDSSGGNLIVSVALHLAQLKAARMPDGAITICTSFLFQCLPSSSRVLSFTDSLLHMEIVILCADAYTGFCPNGTVLEITSRNSFDGLVALNNLKLQVNQLTTIDARVFDGISKLRIMMLRNLSFASLPELTLIDLANNQIETIVPH